MLCVNNISKFFGDIQALDNVNLNIDAGQITALLARNGAGKSTLISIISGLITADKGEIFIDNQLCKSIQQFKSMIGVASQETGLYPGLSVSDNLSFFAQLYGLYGKKRKDCIKKTSRLLGLDTLIDKKVNVLSGGEKRRLHTACSLLHQPQLLLLDEPTVGADPQARNDILNAVQELSDSGTAILYTSHYFPEIESLEADIVIMEKGKVLASGSQPELIDSFGKKVINIEFSIPIAEQAAALIPSSRCHNPNNLEVPLNNDTKGLSHILERLDQYSHHLVNIKQPDQNLENTFLNVIQLSNAT